MGIYDLILTSTSLLIPIITLQIADAAYRWLLEKNQDAQKKVSAISNGLLVVTINSFIFLFICFIASFFVHFEYLIHSFLFVFFATLMTFLQQITRGLGNTKLYSAAGILNTILLIIFSVVFFAWFKYKLGGLLIAVTLANAITACTLIVAGGLKKYIDFSQVARKEIKAMMQYSWPLIPNAIGWWLINEINRFIILFYLGVDANGIFAIAIRFPSLMIAANSIFMLSWQDHAIAAEEGGAVKNASYSKIFSTYMVLQFTMVIVLTSVSKYAVKWIIDPKFFEAWQYMPLLYLSVAFSTFSSFYGTAYLNTKKTKGLFSTTLAGSISNIIICLLLIKPLGLYAPAIGTLAGYAVMWFIRVRQTKGFFNIKINWSLFILLLCLSAASIELVSIGNKYADIFTFVSAVIIAIVLNRTLAKYVCQYIFHNLLIRFRTRSSI